MSKLAPVLVDFAALAESYLLACRAENKSPQTVQWYEHKLRGFLTWLTDQEGVRAVDAVTPELVRRFLDHLRGPDPWHGSQFQPTRPVAQRSPATIRGYAQVIKGFYSWLEREGHLPSHPLAKLRMPKVPDTLIRPLDPAEMRQLLGAPDTRMVSGLRDAAMLSIFLDCGLRVSELVGLRLSDVGHGDLTVTGKGSKRRVVGFGTATQRALNRWLTVRAALADEHEPHIFVSEEGRPLSKHAVEKQVRQLAQRAGLRRVWPHLLRHTFAVSFLRAGGDAFTLQKLLGHTTLETTKLYVYLAGCDVLEVYRRASPLDHLRRV
ncbi:MAG: tyrosine-type recombinase/integrase [Dehalococcoidia bacterium]